MTGDVVAEFIEGDGYTMRLTAQSSGQDLLTMLSVEKDGKILYGGGMGGEPVPPGEFLNFSQGIDTDSGISAVVVRAAEGVRRLELSTPGSSRDIALHPVAVVPGVSVGASLIGAHEPGRALVAFDATGAVLQMVDLLDLAERMRFMRSHRPGQSGGGWIASSGDASD